MPLPLFQLGVGELLAYKVQEFELNGELNQDRSIFFVHVDKRGRRIPCLNAKDSTWLTALNCSATGLKGAQQIYIRLRQSALETEIYLLYCIYITGI